ncbi:hypothetical protein BGX38DRAFT_522816 [Terfezia claveryi]|nr:hypothetical protein BGX38DRAFT_522816 [Terfezia claveryi]
MLSTASILEPSFPRGHRPTLTCTSVSTMGSLSIPRIRILLAPYMSPYVVPMKKAQTWELLLNLLSNLFGPSILTSVLKITDTQGDVIHRHVWEDLLEPGMIIVVDTGPLDCSTREGGISSDGKGKEKAKAKQIQDPLPFGQPPHPRTTVRESSPKQSQSRDMLEGNTKKQILPEGKLPDEIIEQWAKEQPKSPGTEEKRITTVSMFIQQGMNDSKVTLGQVNLGEDMEKMENLQDKPPVECQKTFVQDNPRPPVQLSRKKSTVAKVANCFHGIKSRYGSSTSKETNVARNSGTMGMVNEITTAPRKERQPKPPPPSIGITVPSVVPTATASGAISNQPVKPATRTASLRAFFRYFDEGKPVAVPRRAKSTPSTSAKGEERQRSPGEGITRPTTAPPSTIRNPGPRQRTNTVDNSGYASDGPPVVSGALRRRATGEHLNAPATLRSRKPAMPKPPIVDKPLPKLPYTLSTFPAPTPPRSPLIKAVVNPPQLQPQTQTIAQTTTTPSPPTHKIIPWDELNRRLAMETQSRMGAQLRKSSISAGISHRRGRSADSGFTMSGSVPLSFGVSRPTTAVVQNVEVAINGFGMRSKLISVGKTGPQVPEQSTSARQKAMLGRGVRRVASDDTIRSGTGSWRLTNQCGAELKRPQTAAEKRVGVGLGIDMLEELPKKIEPLGVQGGRLIAIGVIPED